MRPQHIKPVQSSVNLTNLGSAIHVPARERDQD